MRANPHGTPTRQNQNNKKPDDPQIPRPDLRFATKNNSETTKETGPEPNTDQTQNRFATRHNGVNPPRLKINHARQSN